MLGLALALVVPAAALPCRGAERPGRPVVGGSPPASVLAVADVVENAPVVVSSGLPVRVSGPRVPPWLRTALDAGEPTVTVHRPTPRPWVPGRNLWVLLLAASLLTGPLVESIPGERAQRTWETLRATPLTGLELLVGKWWAWTVASVGVAMVGVMSGLLTGTQTVDWALCGVPMVLGAVVALGLWLLRGVADPGGAATIPVRVVPLVLMVALAGSVLLAEVSPLLAALVPFGGPLWLSSHAAAGPLSVVLAGLSTLGVVAGLLIHGARTLEVHAGGASVRWRRAGLWSAVVAVGTVVLHAPAMWARAGGRVDISADHQAWTAGLMWLLVAGLVHLRGGPTGRRGRLHWQAVAAGLAAGGGLAVVAHGLGWASSGPHGAGWLGLVVFAVGQELLFRGELVRRVGPVAAGLAWTLLAWPQLGPVAPVAAVVLGILAGPKGHWERSLWAQAAWMTGLALLGR